MTVLTAFTQEQTRALTFRLLADWRNGAIDQPNLHTVYDHMNLEPGDIAPAWVRRIWYDAVTGRAVETATEYLHRIGVPTPVRFRGDDDAVTEAAERGRSAITDPRDHTPEANLKAQARAVRSYWARAARAS